MTTDNLVVKPFETINGRVMHYEPGVLVATTDAMYIVQKAGNWAKVAEQRKGKWKLLRGLDQRILDHALEEIQRLKTERAGQMKRLEAALEKKNIEEATQILEEIATEPDPEAAQETECSQS